MKEVDVGYIYEDTQYGAVVTILAKSLGDVFKIEYFNKTLKLTLEEIENKIASGKYRHYPTSPYWNQKKTNIKTTRSSRRENYNVFKPTAERLFSKEELEALDYYKKAFPTLEQYFDKGTCDHNWVETKLSFRSVWDCSKCGAKKEEV